MPTRRQIVFGSVGVLVLFVLAVVIGIFATQKNKIVDCEMSEWGAWGPCDICGVKGGKQTRERTIKRQPANGGDPCPPETEKIDCFNIPACSKS